ncbi:MAG TPA: PIN domain-containing protein [Rhodopila sp.]|nr:PIN domain-containing protein [Rhodopila sp.]
MLLDTHSVIAMMKAHGGFLSRLRQHKPSAFGISAVVMHGLYFGAHKSERVRANLARVAALRFEVVPLDAEDARAAADTRARLGRAGTPIRPYDVLIAAQALARNLTVVTHNVREFAHVPGLRVENWI